MRRLLVDSSVIIDALAHRAPFDKSARLLLALGRLGEFELWMSASQFTDVFCVLSGGGEKTMQEDAKYRASQLRKGVRIGSVTSEDVDAAIASTWPGVEDACVYQVAMKIKADAIVTRNGADFEKSFIPVLDCDQLFERVRKTEGISYDYVNL